MAKFLKRIGVFSAIQLLIGIALFSNAAKQPRYGFVAAFEDKAKLLREHREPHLILVGGSNVAFGFDSATLKNELNIPVINVGLHASTGLQFYLDVASAYAKPGDTIVLVPEWHLFATRLHAEPGFIQELVRQSPSSWRFLLFDPGIAWKKFFDEQALPEIANLVREGFKSHDRIRDQQAIREAESMLYSRLHFNSCGDFVGHHNRKASEVDCLETAHFFFNKEKYLMASQRINQCAEACRRKGATVFLAYSPIPEPVFERSVQSLNAAHHFLEANLDIPILHPPTSVKYPVSYFFDTVNHLYRQGASIRTEMIATLLREYNASVAANRSELIR